MFMDGEIGLALAHGRSMRAFSRDVQGLVDEMDADIRSLRGQLTATREALADERAKRLRAEMNLRRVLDMPV